MKGLKANTLFFITTILITAAGLLLATIFGQEVLDFNLYDTYYVIGTGHFTALLAALYLLSGVTYFVLFKFEFKTSVSLNKIHSLISCGSVFLYWVLYPVCAYIEKSPLSPGYLEMLVIRLSLLAVVVQPVLLINIIIGLTRGRRKVVPF